MSTTTPKLMHDDRAAVVATMLGSYVIEKRLRSALSRCQLIFHPIELEWKLET